MIQKCASKNPTPSVGNLSDLATTAQTQDLDTRPDFGRAEHGDMAFLYKITNTENQKCYIGWTGTTVTDRWQRHVKDALKNRDNRKFYNAIRKYGTTSWSVETLEQVDTIEEAKQREIFLIEHYDSYNTGYNATKGGDGNNGIVMSAESNQARSRALKGIPKNYAGMKDKKHRPESKKLIAEKHTGMKKPWVKWTKEQISKRSMTRRSLTKDQYDTIHELRSQGLTIKVIAAKIGATPHVVKKWSNKDWNL